MKKLREIDDDLRLRKKKVAEMSRQRQTEELVSKRKTTLELKNPFFLPSLL